MTSFNSNMNVLTRIGEAFVENNSMNKTQLFFFSRTNWNSFEKYLKWLESKNYVICKNTGKDDRYMLTSDGLEIFSMLLKVVELMRTNRAYHKSTNQDARIFKVQTL